jgi:hypothetical protein
MLPENALEDLRLNEDIHELNKEIVRLAYFLNVDIENPKVVDDLLSTNLPNDHEHFHKLATLKGLILLRGHIHQLRAEHGVPDGNSPLEEEIFQRLNLGHHQGEEVKSI